MRRTLFIMMLLIMVNLLMAQIMQEGFENGGSLPTGWTSVWEGGSVVPFDWTCQDGGYQVPAQAHSGNYNAYLRNDNGSFQAGNVRLTPTALDLSSYAGSNVALSFWQTNANDGSIMWNELRVYYKTSAAGSWISLLVVGNENSVWQKRTVVLPQPYTADYWISFIGEETMSNGVCIDDVEVFEYFYQPQNLSISSSDAQVDLSWSAPEQSDNLTQYKIFRNRQELATVSSSELQYVDNSVLNHQAYEYYVKAVYNENESFPSNEVFDAPLGMLLPYFEGYENNGEKPFGWSEIFELNEQSWTYENGGRAGQPSAAYEGDYNALLSKFSSWTGRKTKLVSPKLNLSAYTDATLTFQMANVEDYSDNPDILRLWYKNSPTAEWTLIEEYDTQHAQWTEKTIVLPNVSDTYWIALEGYAYLGYGICVDDFAINSSSISTYSVSIFVQDEEASPVNDAQVNLAGYGTQNTIDGWVVFDEVAETTEPGIAYSIIKEGFNEYIGSVIVDEDESLEVMLIAQPVFVSATTNPDGFAIEVSFDKEMADPSNEPLESFYYDYVSKDLFDIISLELKPDDAQTIILNLDVAITHDDEVVLGYNKGSIISASGGILQDFSPIEVENNVITAVEDIHHRFTVYPNPAEEYISIYTENNAFFKLLSLHGKIIRSGEIQAPKYIMELQDILPGVYFLQLEIDGKQMSKKIIIL